MVQDFLAEHLRLQRPVKEESLHHGNTHIPQQIHGLLIFHALHAQRQMKGLTQVIQAAQNDPVVFLGFQVLDVLPVHLDLADGQTPQVIEAGVAGSEVVQRHTETPFHQVLAELVGDFKALDQGRLRQLADYPPVFQSGGAAAGQNVIDQVGVRNLLGRDVYIDVGRQPHLMPPGALPHRLIHNPPAHRNDHIGKFQGFNQLRLGQVGQFRVMVAKQRLRSVPDRLVSPELHHRLINQPEVLHAVVDVLAKFGFQQIFLVQRCRGFAAEENGLLGVGFGVELQRRIGVLNQILPRPAVHGIDGHTDSGPHINRVSLHQSGTAQVHLERSQLLQNRRRVAFRQVDQKFVPLQPVQAQVVGDVQLEDSGKLLENGIGKAVSENFIEHFEIPDVNAQDRAGGVGIPGQELRHLLFKAVAVFQARQLVKIEHLVHPFLCPLFLSDIHQGAGNHHRITGGIVQSFAMAADPHDVPLLGPHPILRHMVVAFSAEEWGEGLQENFSVLRHNKAQDPVHGIGKGGRFQGQNVQRLGRKGTHVVHQIQLIDVIRAALQNQLVHRLGVLELLDHVFHPLVIFVHQIIVNMADPHRQTGLRKRDGHHQKVNCLTVAQHIQVTVGSGGSLFPQPLQIPQENLSAAGGKNFHQAGNRHMSRGLGRVAKQGLRQAPAKVDVLPVIIQQKTLAGQDFPPVVKGGLSVQLFDFKIVLVHVHHPRIPATCPRRTGFCFPSRKWRNCQKTSLSVYHSRKFLSIRSTKRK